MFVNIAGLTSDKVIHSKQHGNREYLFLEARNTASCDDVDIHASRLLPGLLSSGKWVSKLVAANRATVIHSSKQRTCRVEKNTKLFDDS